ncbi:MAG TPA: thioesterase family protein [Candidatus Binatia bacterium]
MSEAIYIPQDGLFVATTLARGPWSPDAQHGGPPSALLARAIERFEDGERMQVARLTIELLRPVPIAPLAVRTAFERPGKKVQLVRASLFAGDTEVARATGLRMRRAELPVPQDVPAPQPPPGPDSGHTTLPPWAEQVQYDAFHSRAVEHRFVAGSFLEPGPATDWIRLRVPLVAGEETSPLCRVAAAADFGNGVSWVLNRNDGWAFINPDLTIHLHRYPVGEWVCIDSVTLVGPQGAGIAESRLFDERGALGRSVQSLLLERHA